jgi:hypothetical protein
MAVATKATGRYVALAWIRRPRDCSATNETGATHDYASEPVAAMAQWCRNPRGKSGRPGREAGWAA